MRHSISNGEASIVALAVFAAGEALCFSNAERRRQDRQRHMTPALWENYVALG